MKRQEIKVEIKVDDETASGKFTNFSNITQSNEEFILDFIFINPSPAPGFGKLVSRNIMTPGHAKRFMTALAEQIANYERHFGEIKMHVNEDENKVIQ